MDRSRSILTAGKLCGPLLLLIALCVMAACSSTGKISDFRLASPDGDKAVFNHEKVTISAWFFDDEDRTGYLQKSGRTVLARELGELPLSTFLLGIANGNSSEVIIDPASIRFVTGTGPVMSPLTYAHLYMALPADKDRQKVLQDLQGITFDRPVTVPPGGREERLLLFQRPEKVARDVALVLGGMYLGGAYFKGSLTFEAIPLEE